MVYVCWKINILNMILLHGLSSFLLWALGIALFTSIISFIILQALIGRYKSFVFKNYSDEVKWMINFSLLLLTLAFSVTIFWITLSSIDFIHNYFKQV
jgi:hypothetical protein